MINEDALKSLERLHQLKNDGIITEEDFEKAKGKLLGSSVTKRAAEAGPPVFTANGINKELFVPFDGTLPHESDAIGWMLLPLRRYADFTGRSCRREYWMFTLLYAAFVFCLVFVGLMGGGDGSLAGLAFLILLLGSLGILVPAIAVQVRRLHDQDKSGWLALLNLIPWVGGIVC